MLRLSPESKRWLVIGVVFLLVLVLLFFWVMPAYDAAARADDEWRQSTTKDLKRLDDRSEQIPSAASLAGYEEFAGWVEAEAKRVETGFQTRTDNMLVSLAGKGEVTRAAFKNAYMHSVRREEEQLRQYEAKGIMATSELKHIFPEYPWAGSSPSLPKTDDFQRVLLDYWSRHYLFRTFRQAGVRVVRRLDIGRRAQLTPEHDGVRVSANLLMPPRKATHLAETFLRVLANSRTPIYQLDSFTVRAAPEFSQKSNLVEVHVVLHILLVKP